MNLKPNPIKIIASFVVAVIIGIISVILYPGFNCPQILINIGLIALIFLVVYSILSVFQNKPKKFGKKTHKKRKR